nr:unnamed protein product [Spirometra erinaceieuropaei]
MGAPSVPSTSSVVDQPPDLEMPELVPEVCTEPVDISGHAVADKCFLADLREFCLEAQMPLSTTKKLFRMLRPYHPEVPKDPRTLLQTPRTCISKPLNKGNYVHLGLGRGLVDQLHSLPEATVPEIHIQLHIDGMKIFKGSSQGLWPILARVRHPVVGQPFIVGVFCGPGKPDPLDDFLGDCVGELKDLLASGLRNPHTQNIVKMYSVVEFVNDKAVAVVAAAWFYDVGSVMWPKNHKERAVLLNNNRRPPDGTKVYAVRQMKSNLTLLKARQLVRKAELSDNLSSSEPGKLGRGMRKKYVRRLTSESDEASSDSDELLYRPRQLLGWPTPPRIPQTDEQMPQVISQHSQPTPLTSYRIINDAIGQNPRFSNCNREVLRLTAINWFHGSKDRYGGRAKRRRNIHTFHGVPTDDLACPQLSPPKHTNRK